jgi:hypothetical protein
MGLTPDVMPSKVVLTTCCCFFLAAGLVLWFLSCCCFFQAAALDKAVVSPLAAALPASPELVLVAVIVEDINMEVLMCDILYILVEFHVACTRTDRQTNGIYIQNEEHARVIPFTALLH